MMQPLVTVLIPAYNAEKTIRRAIDSAFTQDYPATEILVVDDGSTDATSEIVGTYEDPRIRLLRLPTNRGEGGVLNEGIAIAKGQYIAFLDADDEWLPGKLSRQIVVLESNQRATMATCGCRFVDLAGNLVEEFGMQPPGFAKDQIWRALLVGACIAKPCVIVRSSALRRVGLFDTKIRIAADQDMWIRLAIAGEVEFVNEYLTIAHDTPSSLTKVYRKDADRYVLQVVYRNIAAQRKYLSREDIRSILSERYTSLGRNIYREGRIYRGSRLLLQAVALGGHRGENLWYLITASPPARLMKRHLQIISGVERSTKAVRQNGSTENSLLEPREENLVEARPGPPILIVGVDLEAEFDWSGPRPRTDNRVENVREQMLVHKSFEKYGVRPIYLVDYAAATQANGFVPIRELVKSGKCEVGAHLQTWENPPFAEELSERTSFSHNLPAWLQKEKLSRLTQALRANIGIEPIAYRAGRYGVGEEIAWILKSLGYQIDMSVVPNLDLRRHHGPHFRRVFNQPYWFGRDAALLEIPLTVGFCGTLSSPALSSRFAPDIYNLLSRLGSPRAHGLGLFARLGLVERITLTPEGISLDEMMRLTRTLLSRGDRVFSLNYHSSSLLPGNTPYVRTLADRDRFLKKIEAYLDFFFGKLGGKTMTPSEFLKRVRRPGEAATMHAATESVAATVGPTV
jgi:glycosyltransferase involved in cell wall biosynthesis